MDSTSPWVEVLKENYQLPLPVWKLFAVRLAKRNLPRVSGRNLEKLVYAIEETEAALRNGRCSELEKSQFATLLTSFASPSMLLLQDFTAEGANRIKDELDAEFLRFWLLSITEQWKDDTPISSQVLETPLWSDANSPLLIGSLTTRQLVFPTSHCSEGQIVMASCIPFLELAQMLLKEPASMTQLPPRKFEEIIAGAFQKSGFDEVVLTPRSGDYGKDIIAIKHGFGAIKVIASVKAYRPGRAVRQEEIRDLVGALAMDKSASKAMFITTGRLPRGTERRKDLASLIPTRLEIIDMARLVDWFKTLAKSVP